MSNQRGAAPILLLIAAVGLLAFLLISNTFSFKDRLFSFLFHKPASRAAGISDYDDATALALGIHRLSADEFAVVEGKNGNQSGKTTKFVAKLKNNQIYSQDADSSSSFSIIEGSDTTNTYVKLTSGITIHNVDELTSKEASQKIDPAISRHLAQTDTVPVIIQFNLPFDKYYEKDQDQNKIKDKESKLNEAKNKLDGILKDKGKRKDGLKVIKGVSADIKKEALDELSNNPLVKKVELDRVVHVSLDTSTNASNIDATDVWPLFDGSNNTLTGIGKVIAVIDTGVDYTHPDLGGCLGANCKVIGGHDFVNNDSDPMDDMGHGTHVAATAAGKGVAGGQRLWGVAPDAKILAYKVCDSGGSCYGSNIIAAISVSIDPNGDGNPSDHADVGTMSLGGSGNPDDSMSLAVDNAASAGVVFTIAAGNSGPTASTIRSPGTARTAITVAAACKKEQIGTNGYCTNPIASFSSRGPLIWNGVDIQKPDIAAPGVYICAARWDTAFSGAPTCFDDKHIRISGTSMATPHMAGAAALLLQSNSSLTPDQVKKILKANTTNLGMTYNDQGAGEVNLKSAIPISQKVISNPSVWQASSSAAVKTSITQKTFLVTSATVDISTLSVSIQPSIPGATIASDKPTLNVGIGATDSFTATITVDNDLAKAGTYFPSIIFSQNGVNQGSIPILLTVTPTLAVTPTGGIDYGVDDPSQSTWTSGTKTYTAINLRSDVSQTVNVSLSGYPSGVTLTAPSTLTIPAGQSANFDSQLNVTNTSLPNSIYNGSIVLSNSANAYNISTKFTKFYVVTVADSNTTDLHGALIYLYDRNNKLYFSYGLTPAVFYLNSPGTYDLIVGYGFNVSNVFKEGINISQGQTTINVSKADANHTVEIVPTDINGNNIATQTKTGSQVLAYVANNQIKFWSIIFGGRPTKYYYSNVGSSYQVAISAGTLPPNIYDYGLSFIGLQNDLQVTNTPADLKKTTARFDLDQQSGTLTWPSYLGCTPLANGTFCFGFTTDGATLPIQEVLYSARPDSTYGYFMTQVRDVLSPTFNRNGQRWYDNTKTPLISPIENSTQFVGLGPTYFAGKMQNSSTAIRLNNYFISSYGPPSVLLRQDFAVKTYPQLSYTVAKNGTAVASGTIPSLTDVWSSFNPTLSSVTVPSAGAYQLTMDVPYSNKGISLTGKVNASFDTSKADPNPPAIKRLYYYANNARSEVYDKAVDNRLEVEVDPVGGGLKQVDLSYSTDGTTFQPLTVDTSCSGVYKVDLPVLNANSKISLRLSATDDSNNNLTYSFEMPIGTAPALGSSVFSCPNSSPAPSPSSSTTPSPTPSSTPTPTPTLTPSPTPPSDTQPPTAPTNLLATPISSSQINLSWTASTDNVGVKGYDIYRDNVKVATVSTTSYGDANLLPSTAYSYFVMAFDAAGNTSTPSNTSQATTQPPPQPAGSIKGTVSTSLGGVLPGVRVSTSVNGSNQIVITSSQGVYIFPSLPPAAYSVRYQAPNYVVQTINEVVASGQATTKDVTLVFRKQ